MMRPCVSSWVVGFPAAVERADDCSLLPVDSSRKRHHSVTGSFGTDRHHPIRGGR